MFFNLRTFLVSLFLLIAINANSQVLISLIFGEALNTDKIEFGLIGGDNISFISGISGSKPLNNWNLGFYFHINLKNSSYLSTGVLVKSTVGASGMPTYSVGDPEFDNVFANGELIKKINYFYVPIMYQKRFNNRWYMEGGIQPGLRYGGTDTFEVIDAFGGDLSYVRNVKSDYKHFDFGLIAGAGYKFRKEVKSVAIGVNYYYGLVDVSRDESTSIKNSSVYFYVKIPIGKNGKQPKDK